MPTYAYRGFDSAGQTAQGLIEALDLKEAREKLQARGVLAEKIAAAGEASAGRRRRRGFDLDQRAMCYRELAALLAAGLPLASALEVLIQSPELGTNRALLAGVRDRLREGSTLARALRAASPEVSAFEEAGIEVGERVGTLDLVLARLAAFMEEQAKLRDRVQTALIYPAFVLALAVLVAVAMLGFLLPWVSQRMLEAGVPLSGVTRAMLAVRRWIVPAGLLVAAAGWLGRQRLRRRLGTEEEYRRRFNLHLFRLPLVGRGYAALVNLRFARTLALLLKGGVQLVEGLALAGRATGSAWVIARTAEGAEQVRHGRSLAETLRGIEPLNAALPAWVQAGEASGHLDVLLDHAADRYQQQWDRLISRGLGVLELVLILAVGLFVMVIALAILLPILTLNRALM